jgi:hypothetical protein
VKGGGGVGVIRSNAHSLLLLPFYCFHTPLLPKISGVSFASATFSLSLDCFSLKTTLTNPAEVYLNKRFARRTTLENDKEIVFKEKKKKNPQDAPLG